MSLTPEISLFDNISFSHFLWLLKYDCGHIFIDILKIIQRKRKLWESIMGGIVSSMLPNSSNNRGDQMSSVLPESMVDSTLNETVNEANESVSESNAPLRISLPALVPEASFPVPIQCASPAHAHVSTASTNSAKGSKVAPDVDSVQHRAYSGEVSRNCMTEGQSRRAGAGSLQKYQ